LWCKPQQREVNCTSVDNCVDVDVEMCGYGPCPVNGQWGVWSEFSLCDAPCGGGNMSRTRKCDSPPTSLGGRYCEGDSNEKITCNNETCKPAVVSMQLSLPNEKYIKLYENTFSFPARQFRRKLLEGIAETYRKSGHNVDVDDIEINSISADDEIDKNQKDKQ
jgi:hypothetical protein